MLMSRWTFAVAALLLAAGAAVPLSALDPPVITATYETARGSEEDDADDLLPEYVRHTVLLSARQEFGEHARLTTPVRVSRRHDPQVAASESLTIGLQPRLDLDLGERLDLGTELILRHADAPEMVTLGGRLASSLKLGEVTVDGWLKPLFDTYAQQPERNRQLYTASLGIVYRHQAVRVSGRYRGSARFGLGEASEVDLRLSHLVNVSLRLDLARLR